MRQQRDDPCQRGPEDGGGLAHQVVEAEELARLADGHEASEQRPGQGLDATLDQPDDERHHHELALGLQKVGVAGDSRVHRNPDENAGARADPLAQPAERQGRRKAYELHQQQRRDQAVLVESQ